MPAVSFIPCLTWVGKGLAHGRPTKIRPKREELLEVIKEMKLKEAEYNSRPPEQKDPKPQSDEDTTSEREQEFDDYYDFDNYDNEESAVSGNIEVEQLILDNDQEDSDSEESDADSEEFTVKPDDNLILTGHVEDGACMLEVYVFNNDKAELFVLHDLFLESFPLCIEWLDFDQKAVDTPGNFAAVGTMTPKIDIWDLRVSGCLYPAYSLGDKKSKSNAHKGAVLDLSWNRLNRNILASGSEDRTVKLWDLAQGVPATTMAYFEEKVQTLKWHPIETQNLLVGSCDGKARLFDCRQPSAFRTWEFGNGSEIERVLWNQFNPFCYLCATDKGMVHYVDIRNPTPLWNLKAHDKEVTGMAFSSQCQDLFLTSSMDGAVKVWDVANNTPELVTIKSMNIGEIHNIVACPDVPYVFSAGGSKKDNHLYVWDVRENGQVMDRFKGRKLVDSEPDNSRTPMEVKTEDEPQPSTSRNTHPNPNPGRIPINKKKSQRSLQQGTMEEAQRKKKKNKKKAHKNMHPKSSKGPRPS